MSEYFVFDGVDCRDFSVHAFDSDTFGSSSREYEGITIPGRNGNILIDNKRYENRSHSYGCIIYENCEQNLENFRNFLVSRVGYCRLEDTIHPDEFYQACYMEEFSPTLSMDRKMAKAVVTFDRKPQRFLKAGEIMREFTATGTIYNPTRFPSHPLIRVTGSGSFEIGENIITVTNNSTYIDIDCEIMEAFTGNTLANSKVSFSKNDFPTLKAGSNAVKLNSGITKVQITPRWYTM